VREDDSELVRSSSEKFGGIICRYLTGADFPEPEAFMPVRMLETLTH